MAAIVGLGVLSLLYFAQAREVKRLREWAGRAPERDAELQQRAVTPRRSAGRRRPPRAPSRRVPRVPRRRPRSPRRPPRRRARRRPARRPGRRPRRSGDAAGDADGPQAAGARDRRCRRRCDGRRGDGRRHARHREARCAGARQAGRSGCGDGLHHHARRAGGDPGRGARPGEARGRGSGDRAAVGHARCDDDTAAPQRPRRLRLRLPRPPPAAPPRLQRRHPRRRAHARDPRPRRSARRARRARSRRARARGRRPSTGRAAACSAVVLGGIAIAAVAILLITQVFSGDDATSPQKPNSVGTPTTPAASDGSGTAAKPQPKRETTQVAVFNGTTVTGLARAAADKLTAAGYKNVSPVTTDTTNQARATTVVYWQSGSRREGVDVAKLIGVSKTALQPMDQNARVLGGGAPVVVIVGADQAQ